MDSIAVVGSGGGRETLQVSGRSSELNLRVRAAALWELTKPRIGLMILIVASIGFYLGSSGGVDVGRLLNALFGIGLIGAGIAALNQCIERERDKLMRRTMNRPLPAGKISPVAAWAFGTLLTLGGIAYLAVTVNALTAWIGAATAISYVIFYTLLKPVSSLATVVGAFPGAAPPLIGWAAARGELTLEAWVLFAIMFLWQFPHFLAIAWMYREEYERAGIKMLPGVAGGGAGITAQQSLFYALLLIPVSLLPVLLGMAGMVYAAGAVLLGAFYLSRSLKAFDDAPHAAKSLLMASVIYLPLLFGLMLIGW